jgi:hypothetical protein
MRHETVIARQLGNCLEITIQIPWEDVHGKNKWQAYLAEKAEEEKQRIAAGLEYWSVIESRVIQEWNRSQNISKAAKAGPCKYYTARIIIDKHRKAEREKKRLELIRTAQRLAGKGVPYHRIAEQVGKCPETIRLWLKHNI